MLLGLPWWIYMVIVFIFFSGYMTFRALRAEKQLEHQYIEREGIVFMERMEYERLMRQEERDEASADNSKQNESTHASDDEQQLEEDIQEKETQRKQVSV